MSYEYVFWVRMRRRTGGVDGSLYDTLFFIGQTLSMCVRVSALRTALYVRSTRYTYCMLHTGNKRTLVNNVFAQWRKRGGPFFKKGPLPKIEGGNQSETKLGFLGKFAQ